MPLSVEELIAKLVCIFTPRTVFNSRGIRSLLSEIQLNDASQIVDFSAIQTALQQIFTDTEYITRLRDWVTLFETCTRINRKRNDVATQQKFEALNRELIYFFATKKIEWTDVEIGILTGTLNLPIGEAINKFLGIGYATSVLQTKTMKHIEPIIHGLMYDGENIEVIFSIMKHLNLSNLNEHEQQATILLLLKILLAIMNNKANLLQINAGLEKILFVTSQENTTIEMLQQVHYSNSDRFYLRHFAVDNEDELAQICIHCLSVRMERSEQTPTIINTIWHTIISLTSKDGYPFHLKTLQNITDLAEVIANDEENTLSVAKYIISWCVFLKNDMMNVQCALSCNPAEIIAQTKEFLNATTVAYLSQEQLRQRDKIRKQCFEILDQDDSSQIDLAVLLDIIVPTAYEWRKIIEYIGIFNDDFKPETNYDMLLICCTHSEAWLHFNADEIDKLLQLPKDNLIRRLICDNLGLPAEIESLDEMQYLQDWIQNESDIIGYAKFTYIYKILYMRALKKERPEMDETIANSAELSLNDILSRMARLRSYILQKIMPYVDEGEFFRKAVYLLPAFFNEPVAETSAVINFDLEVSKRLNVALPKLCDCIVQLRMMILEQIELAYKEQPEQTPLLLFIKEHKASLLAGNQVADIDVHFQSNRSPFPAWRFLDDLVKKINLNDYQGIVALRDITSATMHDVNGKNFIRMQADLIRMLIFAMDDINTSNDIANLGSVEGRQIRVTDWKISLIEMLSVARRSYNKSDDENDQPACAHGKVGWLFLAFKGHPVLGFDQHEIIKEKTQHLIERIFSEKLYSEMRSNTAVIIKLANMRKLYNAFAVLNDSNIFDYMKKGNTVPGSISTHTHELFLLCDRVIGETYRDSSTFANEIIKMVRAVCNDESLQLTIADALYIHLRYLFVCDSPISSERIFAIYTRVVQEFETTNEKILYNLEATLAVCKEDSTIPVRLQFKQALYKYVCSFLHKSAIPGKTHELFADALMQHVMSNFDDEQRKARMTRDFVMNEVAVKYRQVMHSLIQTKANKKLSQGHLYLCRL